jgi:hypothetical protein
MLKDDTIEPAMVLQFTAEHCVKEGQSGVGAKHAITHACCMQLDMCVLECDNRTCPCMQHV